MSVTFPKINTFFDLRRITMATELIQRHMRGKGGVERYRERERERNRG